MRQDIEFDMSIKDLALRSERPYSLLPAKWSEANYSEYTLIEVDVPYNTTKEELSRDGFYCSIPYWPRYKPIYMLIRKIKDENDYTYMVADPSYAGLYLVSYFIVKAGLYGGEPERIKASQLPLISGSDFYCRMEGNTVYLYSAEYNDFKITQADTQNANFMICCVPSNNYRYPLTGVGLSRWLNSTNINSGELATIMKREFAEDGVTILDATYNYKTQQLDTFKSSMLNTD